MYVIRNYFHFECFFCISNEVCYMKENTAVFFSQVEKETPPPQLPII